MSAAQVRRSDGAWEVPSPDTSRDSQPLRLAYGAGGVATRCTSTHAKNEIQPHLDAIHRELVELKHRRERLEAQRKELLEGRREHAEGQRTGCVSGSVSTHAGVARSHSTSGLTFAHPCSEMDSLTACSGLHAAHERHSKSVYQDSFVLANMKPIPSEKERRRLLKATPHLAVKNALRTAAQHDSTLLMGSFLLEDNPHTCTFARERRFRPLLGQKGKYFLSADVAVDQCMNRSHANATKSLSALGSASQTPGPGAYTPRYSKLSRPPRSS
ncbi:hypothetical protein conserved [Leishmania donovani]|uniref:Uncharacterized protein n=3 Tax=Leishmania donovani species complex TaxID=38574 RepID=A4IAG4_LEIIN|nr:conserved hypothetical protein [Leishmania infantum JPCM5]XP_003864535.1 hypothetical protein, conserved [Leishmania donovani]CAC9541369.1 hypothetical_protein_-_conserved [Leishmania infantum]AYU82743.1 hypothetical protein LdCL_340047000 [Leishmania donovani]CAJ1992759.1 hypothetical protein conserved [Leishmania donovani]CAM71821.1 conserved hypothetical protein [Leishmania infantum JPCM5]CBZ37853.1 hypothetical protein, conserved [Leishmania donovani]|eukprot:XP_001468733.1 conserved hypothetical protein [Leishmania infantum JPCM5]